jgi:hypothetical protein
MKIRRKKMESESDEDETAYYQAKIHAKRKRKVGIQAQTLSKSEKNFKRKLFRSSY